MTLKGELLDMADHVNFTRRLLQSAQMAVGTLDHEENRKALDALLDTILDRLDAATDCLEQFVLDHSEELAP